MNQRLTKPFTKNVRLDSPLGLLGVPPDDLTSPRAVHAIDTGTTAIPIGCRRGTHERFS